MSETPRALITGIGGQDGSYLAEFLVEKGYEVHGIDRRRPGNNGGVDTKRLPYLSKVQHDVTLHDSDVRDRSSLERVVRSCEPDEIYNLAAIAFVPDSFDRPELVRETNAVGVANLLSVLVDCAPAARFFQASSSEMFGVTSGLLDEEAPLRPVSPYGDSKAEAHRAVSRFREEHRMHCCCGISFNHESPRRGLKFVTRKVTDAAAKIKLGLTDTLSLGNLEAKRDWGYAPEYVEAMWLMLASEEPSDYVLATGKSHTVREMADLAFKAAGLHLDEYLVEDESLRRPVDPPDLVGDASKARERLGWESKMELAGLIKEMVDADLERLGSIQ